MIAVENQYLTLGSWLLVCGLLSVFSLFAAAITLITLGKTRRQFVELSHLFENAIDRLEKRHDGDYARMVAMIASLESRLAHKKSPHVARLSEPKPTHISTRKVDNLIIYPGAASAVTTAFIGHKSVANDAKQNRNKDNLKIETILKKSIFEEKLAISLEPIIIMPSVEVCGYIAYGHVCEMDIRRINPISSVKSVEFELQLVLAAARVSRQLLSNTDVPVPIYCSISPAMLQDHRSVSRMAALLSAQPKLKKAIVLLITSDFALESNGETKKLSAALDVLTGAGYEIAIEGITDVDFNFSRFSNQLWFLDADDLSKFAPSTLHNSIRDVAVANNLQIVAMNSDLDLSAIDLDDLGVGLVTSRSLGTPRLVRAPDKDELGPSKLAG